MKKNKIPTAYENRMFIAKGALVIVFIIVILIIIQKIFGVVILK